VLLAFLPFLCHSKFYGLIGKHFLLLFIHHGLVVKRCPAFSSSHFHQLNFSVSGKVSVLNPVAANKVLKPD